MIALFLERLALLSSLSAIVLAVLWPHIRLKIFPLFNKLIQAIPSVFSLSNNNKQQQQQQQRVNHHNRQVFEHPKFSGHQLKRVTSEKESYKSTFGSIAGFSQTRLDGQPSFAHERTQQYGSGFLYPGSGLPPSRGHSMGPTPASQRNQFQSSMSLTIFSACVIALIAYTLMKMLTVKLSRTSSSSSSNGCWPSVAQNSSRRASMGTQDLRRDKRRLLKLSREERTRELILHHGGKNVSKAVRFLADELEKQKRLLVESLSENLPCNCRCHSAAAAALGQGVPETEEIAKAPTTSAPAPEPTTSTPFESTTATATAEAEVDVDEEITGKVGEPASETARTFKLKS